MVRVCTGLCRDLPCIVPVKTVLIQKDTHELCNSHRRMGIIHLEGHLLRQIMDIVVVLHKLRDGTLYAGRHEEILLAQTKLLALYVVVVRIEHIHEVARKVLLLHCLIVIALVKGIQLEALYRLRIPDHERIYNVVIVTDDRHIIRDRCHCLIILMHKFCLSGCLIILCADISAEFYGISILRTTQFKGIAVL